MKVVQAYPSYQDIDRGCAIIVQQLLHDHPNSIPNVVVGLTRGGLIPAVIIAHMIEALNPAVKMVPISYSSKTGKGELKGYENQLPLLPSTNVLVVDDIADSGNTLFEVSNFYKDLGHVVHTAALHYKETSVIRPDYFWTMINANSPWIIYPWEV